MHIYNWEELTFPVRASHASLSVCCSSLSFWVRLMAVSRGMIGRRCSLNDTKKVWNTWGLEKKKKRLNATLVCANWGGEKIRLILHYMNHISIIWVNLDVIDIQCCNKADQIVFKAWYWKFQYEYLYESMFQYHDTEIFLNVNPYKRNTKIQKYATKSFF